MSEGYQTAKRVSFTVITTKGTNCDADNLTVTFRDGDRHPMLSFVCSGVQMCLPHEEVREVLFGCADWCPKCDQRLPWVNP